MYVVDDANDDNDEDEDEHNNDDDDDDNDDDEEEEDEDDDLFMRSVYACYPNVVRIATHYWGQCSPWDSRMVSPL